MPYGVPRCPRNDVALPNTPIFWVFLRGCSMPVLHVFPFSRRNESQYRCEPVGVLPISRKKDFIARGKNPRAGAKPHF